MWVKSQCELLHVSYGMPLTSSEVKVVRCLLRIGWLRILDTGERLLLWSKSETQQSWFAGRFRLSRPSPALFVGCRGAIFHQQCCRQPSAATHAWTSYYLVDQVKKIVRCLQASEGMGIYKKHAEWGNATLVSPGAHRPYFLICPSLSILRCSPYTICMISFSCVHFHK